MSPSSQDVAARRQCSTLLALEVLRQIRADPRTRLIPVVMLTSSADDHDLLESYQLGVNSYIVKPVDFEQFSETARQLGYYWLLINKQPTE